MMARDDWCRRKTWTPADQQAFHERNRRSRGSNSKAQYLRIQASTLLQTGTKSLIAAALELLEPALDEYPDHSDCALTYDTAGQCCEALNRIDDAVEYYQKALNREKVFPGIGSLACFHLGKTAVEHDMVKLFDQCIPALEDFGHPVFPWHAYMANGIKALVAESRGKHDLAREHARVALKAAAIRDSGLGRGRADVGIVKNTNSILYTRLVELQES